MDKKSSTTKLRGTEMLNHHFRYRTHTPVDEWHTDSFNEQVQDTVLCTLLMVKVNLFI